MADAATEAEQQRAVGQAGMASGGHGPRTALAPAGELAVPPGVPPEILELPRRFFIIFLRLKQKTQS